MLTTSELHSFRKLFPHTSLTKYIYGNLYEMPEKNALVKVYRNKTLFDNEYEAITILKNYDFVPKILSFGSCCNFHYIIFMKEEGSDLFDCLSKTIFNETTIKTIAKQLFSILKILKNNNIIHKDIKLENIIYDNKTEKIKIIDFEGQYTFNSLAPECFNNGDSNYIFTYKSDVWAAGILLYKLFMRQEAFKSQQQILYSPLYIYKKIPSDFKSFLEGLLQKNPAYRFSVEEALKHKWLEMENEEKQEKKEKKEEKILTEINVTEISEKEGSYTNK